MALGKSPVVRPGPAGESITPTSQRRKLRPGGRGGSYRGRWALAVADPQAPVSPAGLPWRPQAQGGAGRGSVPGAEHRAGQALGRGQQVTRGHQNTEKLPSGLLVTASGKPLPGTRPQDQETEEEGGRNRTEKVQLAA